MTDFSRDSVDVAVIGAGMAGVTAAAGLADAGLEVCVLEKSRGPGGRSATRREGEYRFDHGAQYFTARTPAFRQAVAQWCARGVVAKWHAPVVAFDAQGQRGPADNAARFVGTPGMNAIARSLASDLDCRVEARVTGLAREGDRQWQIVLQDGRKLRAGSLVLTAPPPQAAVLLDGTDTAVRHTVSRVEMVPMWSVMAVLRNPPPIDFGGAFVNAGPLSWIAHDSGKPRRQTEHCWVLHASRTWSVAHVGLDNDAVVRRLMRAFGDLLGVSTATTHAVAHRWLYAQAAVPMQDCVLVDEAAGIVIAGDWCAGSRIEGAWLSGRAAVDALLRRLAA